MKTYRRFRMKRRGYLLLEVMVGGVMAATVLGALMVSLVGARNTRVAASRDATASSLAAFVIERARSLQYDDAGDQLTLANLSQGGTAVLTTPGPDTTIFIAPNLRGEYEVSVTLQPGTETSLSGETLAYKALTVEVSYELRGQIRDVTASTRIYRD